MVGMAVGSWWGLRQVRDFEPAAVRSRDFLRLAGVQLLAAVAPLLLYALMGVLATSARPAPVFLASQVFFPLLAVLCGSIGGYQFPLASRIFFARQTSNQESPGTLYALDLLGACLGALVLSSYLVPVFGFERTAWLMAVANLAPTTLLASQSRLVHG